MNQNRILDHLYGELEPEDELDLLNEIEVDDDLAEELTTTRRILTAYRLAPSPQPPAGVAAQALKEARAVRSQPDAAAEANVWQADVTHTRGRDDISGDIHPSFWDHAWKLAALFVFCFGLAAVIMIEPWKPAEYLRDMNVALMEPRPEATRAPSVETMPPGVRTAPPAIVDSSRVPTFENEATAEALAEGMTDSLPDVEAEREPKRAPNSGALEGSTTAHLPTKERGAAPALLDPLDPEDSLLAVVPPRLERVLPPAVTPSVPSPQRPAPDDPPTALREQPALVTEPQVEEADVVADAEWEAEHPTLALVPSEPEAKTAPERSRNARGAMPAGDRMRTRTLETAPPPLDEVTARADSPRAIPKVEAPSFRHQELRKDEGPVEPAEVALPGFDLVEEVARQRGEPTTDMPDTRIGRMDTDTFAADTLVVPPPAPPLEMRRDVVVPSLAVGRSTIVPAPDKESESVDTTPKTEGLLRMVGDDTPPSAPRAPMPPPLVAEASDDVAAPDSGEGEESLKPQVDAGELAFGDARIDDQDSFAGIDAINEMHTVDDVDAPEALARAVMDEDEIARDESSREADAEMGARSRFTRLDEESREDTAALPEQEYERSVVDDGADHRAFALRTGESPALPPASHEAEVTRRLTPSLPSRGRVETPATSDGDAEGVHVPELTGREEATLRLRRAKIAYDLGDYDRAWKDLTGFPMTEASEDMRIELHALRARTALQRKQFEDMDAAVRDLHPLAPLTAQALWRLREEAMRPRTVPTPPPSRSEAVRSIHIDVDTLPLPEAPTRPASQPFRPTTDPYERSLQD